MMNKYLRQIELIGKEQQEKLRDTKVLVVGTGGLGSPALLALAVSGIETIGIVDNDIVDITNLNRQIIHNETSIGMKKTLSASNRLSEMNKDLDIMLYQERLTESNAERIFSKYHIIVDCVDNYETRKTVSQEAVKQNKTVIEGGIEGFSGFAQIIIPKRTACFNCLDINHSDIQRQVLGASTGIIGSILALECIKQITGLWDSNYSYIAVDMMSYKVDTLFIKNNPNCSCSK